MSELSCPKCQHSEIININRHPIYTSYKCDNCKTTGSYNFFKKNNTPFTPDTSTIPIKNFYSNGLTVIPFKNVLAVEGDIMSCLDKDKLRMNTAVIWIKEVKEHLFLSGEECDDFLKEYQIYLNSK